MTQHTQSQKKQKKKARKMMANNLNIYQKLLEIQKSVDVLKKDARGQGYKYASGENLLKVIRPKMDSLGLLLFQEVESSTREHVLWKTSNGEKQQTVACVKFKFTWIDCETKDMIVNFFEADGFNSWDKAIGSAMTYGERYYLMKTFHIATDELDPDQRDAIKEKTKPAQKKEAPKTSKTVDEMVKLGAGKIDWKDVLKKYSVTGLSQLTDEQASEVIKNLKGTE